MEHAEHTTRPGAGKAPGCYEGRKEKRMVHHVKVIETGDVVEVYFYHKDGVAYVGKNGIKILFEGEYEEID